MSDPSDLLKAVHDDLASVGVEAKAIQAFGDPRGRLGAGVVAAIADIGAGRRGRLEGGDRHDLEAVRGEAGDFKNDEHHRRAQDVARAALKALPALRDIDWHDDTNGNGAPAISVAQGFAQVVPSATGPVTKTVALKRDGDASGTLVVGARISGLQGSDFQLGRDVGPAGDFVPGARSAAMSLTFAPQHLAAPRKGRFELMPPSGAQLGATSGFDFALVPQERATPERILPGCPGRAASRCPRTSPT